MHSIMTPQAVDYVIAFFKYLWPVSASGFSRQDSFVVSEACNVVCLVKEEPSLTLTMLAVSIEVTQDYRGVHKVVLIIYV